MNVLRRIFGHKEPVPLAHPGAEVERVCAFCGGVLEAGANTCVRCGRGVFEAPKSETETSEATEGTKEGTMANDHEIVNKDNVSVDGLMELFKDAYIEVDQKLGDNAFAVVDHGVRFLVAVEAERKRFIQVAAAFRHENLTQIQEMQYANTVNHRLIFIRAAEREGLLFDHFLWIEGGVTKKNVVLTFKQFVSAMASARALYPQSGIAKAA